MKFFGGMVCITRNRPFDFGADPDRGIFNGIIPTVG